MNRDGPSFSHCHGRAEEGAVNRFGADFRFCQRKRTLPRVTLHLQSSLGRGSSCLISAREELDARESRLSEATSPCHGVTQSASYDTAYRRIMHFGAIAAAL